MTAQPLLLDLFCGAGGAGEGYARAGFRVVGVDLDPKPLRHNPHECYQGDALVVLDTLQAGEMWQGYRLRDIAAWDEWGHLNDQYCAECEAAMAADKTSEGE